MIGRAARKVAQYGAVLVVAFTLNFALPHLAPGDAVDYAVAPSGGLDAAQLQQVRAEFGLDRPLPQQYLQYWVDLVGGDLGTSVQFSRPVTAVLADRLPWTLLLVGTATVLSALAGTVLGGLAGWRRRERRDIRLVTTVLAIDAMPAFWIGMVLVGVFAAQLGWFPSFGAVPLSGSGPGYALAVAHRLVLPVLTLVLATSGGTFLLTRGAMLATLDAAHVRMAVAKGVPDHLVARRHAWRTALLPAYTHVALEVGTILGGAVVVETVFAYPGLGRLIFESVLSRDYPVLRGTFLLVVVGVVVANLVADLTYPLLDPRVRQRAGAGRAV